MRPYYDALYRMNVGVDILSPSSTANLSDYKLIYPKDWDDYAKTRDVFNREWNAMLGL